jgi:quercetin dioxygenase-like cupin family protein
VKIMVDAEMAKLSTSHSDERRDLQSFPEAKVITLKKDATIGGHYHKLKDEHFILSEGAGYLRTGAGLEQWQERMQIGRIYTVKAGTPHWFELSAGSVLVGLNSRLFDKSDDYQVDVENDLHTCGLTLNEACEMLGAMRLSSQSTAS